MGVKSTRELSRNEAERRLDEFMEWARAGNLRNHVLEHLLEVFNDAKHDGEGFENYSITPSHYFNWVARPNEDD